MWPIVRELFERAESAFASLVFRERPGLPIDLVDGSRIWGLWQMRIAARIIRAVDGDGVRAEFILPPPLRLFQRFGAPT
jgi:hypothetical protein